jgi:hypothetical protein
MMHGLILFLHILSAKVSTGGHLLLAMVILARAFSEN